MTKLIKQLYIIAGGESKRITAMLVCEVFKSMFEGVSLWAVLLVLTKVCSFIFEHKSIVFTDVVQVFVVALIGVVGKILFGYAADRYKNIASYNMGAENRLFIGDRLKNVNMGYFTSNRLGDISSGLTTVIADLETVGIFIVEMLLVGVIQTLIVGLCIFPFDYVTGLIIAATLVIGMAVNALFQKRADFFSEKLLKYKIALTADILEYVKGIGVVKAFGKSKEALHKVEQTISDTRKAFLGVEQAVLPVQMIFLPVFKIGTCAIIVFALLRYTNGTIGADKAVMLIVASFIVFGGFEIAGAMQNVRGIAVRNLETIAKLRSIPVMSEGNKTRVEKARIEFCNVDFSYGRAQETNDTGTFAGVSAGKTSAYASDSASSGSSAEALLFKNLNCIIPENKTTAIVGPSGSGKTTLCNLMARFWDVSGGSILVGGTDIKEYRYDDLLSQFSMVFQNVYLFDDTIKNNIKFGNPDASDEQVIEAAKQARCHDFITALPDGYDTVLQEGGSNLSGGERQRISIARSLLKPNMFVILDEATSSVDPENEEKLMGALKVLLKNKTAVIIAHRLGTIRGADQIIVLDKGGIESAGTHTELAEKSEIYKRFIGERENAENWTMRV